jgi:hypothetical protein
MMMVKKIFFLNYSSFSLSLSSFLIIFLNFVRYQQVCGFSSIRVFQVLARLAQAPLGLGPLALRLAKLQVHSSHAAVASEFRVTFTPSRGPRGPGRAGSASRSVLDSVRRGVRPSANWALLRMAFLSRITMIITVT